MISNHWHTDFLAFGMLISINRSGDGFGTGILTDILLGVEKDGFKRSELYQLAYEKNIPISATIELLTKCNWKCQHCYLPSHDCAGYNTNKIYQMVDELRELGTLNLVLTGGEIFLREDIIDIITYARNNYFSVTLMSNASLLNKKLIDEIKKLNIKEFSCTLFSMNELVHDEITGVKGSLKKALKNINQLVSAGINVEIKTPILKLNKDSYISVKEFCDKNQIKHGANPSIMGKSNGDMTVKKIALDYHELLEVMNGMDSLNELNEYRPDYSREACPTLKYIIAFDANGNAFPCSSYYKKIGNVHEDSIKEIWYGTKRQNIVNIKSEEIIICKNCNYKEFCYRCPGLAYLEDGNEFGCSSLAKQLAMARHSLYKIIQVGGDSSEVLKTSS